MHKIAFDASSWRDTRHAARRLVRDWRFRPPASSILGLGIGANTAIFSLVDATLFRQQSFDDPERLVDIYQTSNAGGVDGMSTPAYLDVAAFTTTFLRARPPRSSLEV